jgi:hypothetical protein
LVVTMFFEPSGILSSSLISYNGCFFKFGVEESSLNAPPDYNFDQLFKSNLTF